MSRPTDELVAVEYTVPVSAFVNVETGEVERVVQWDEEIKLGAFGEGYRTQRGVSEDEERAAREIAEREVWPAWDSGL
jgi:hypothetical protein